MTSETRIDDLRWGLRWGLRLGVVFSVIVIVPVTIRALDQRLKALEWAWSLVSTWALYAVGAVVGGSIVGLLRHRARTWLSTVLVGFVAALPMAVAGLLMIIEPGEFGAPIIAASVVVSLIWALVGGTIVWRDR